ncbi:MAG: alpha/beta hydrolase [Sphingomonadales bacterium]|nr:alpha/beta hydrolase [Sphingomonadales bacterium]MBU3992898.1 alpha/beta hydrolase [Alphaproteobacteria bacterium]
MPLGQYGGERPPAPRWYRQAMAQPPERSRFTVGDREIELLTWGEVGKPGLLFLHGMSAHADWWSFIAPSFAQDWRCAAISFSGMGGSDWCDEYSFDRFGEEAKAAIDAAKLDAGNGQVIIVGHSMGGSPAFLCSGADERVRGIICVDTPIHPRWGAPAKREATSATHKIYPDVASAICRFRLDPPQLSENHYLIDHIARHGLKQVERDGQAGWQWRFDPALWNLLDRSGVPTYPSRVRCPVIYMHGERSKTIDPEILEFLLDVLPAGTPFIPIPDADHHVLADQPLALIGALRGVLALWPPRG